MAKTFKAKTQNIDRFFSDTNEESIEQTSVEQSVINIPQKEASLQPIDEDEEKYYRLNLKLKAEYKSYLKHESWKAQKSITQYVNDLIKSDIEHTRHTDT